MLAEGGSYVTLVPVASEVAAGVYPASTFTMIVETLQGACGLPGKFGGKCNVAVSTTSPQTASFNLKGELASAKEVHVWCSSEEEQFVNKGTVDVVGGTVTIAVQPDTICTVTTLSNGTKGSHPPPPPSAQFPSEHSDTFESYAEDTQARGFADMYGSFAVRDHALTQVAASVPTGWASRTPPTTPLSYR